MLSFIESLVMHVVNYVLNGIITAIVKLAILFLSATALHPTQVGSIGLHASKSASIIYKVAMNGYWEFAGLAGILLVVSLFWGLMQLQQYHLFGVGPRDDLHALVGRVVYSALAILLAPIFIWLLFHINNTVVVSLTHSALTVNLTHASSASVKNMFPSAVTDAILAVFLYFMWDVIVFLAVIFMLWAIAIWLAREFEIVFWITVLPVAAALAASDPQQKLFTYVRTQLVGLIFQQALMALAILLTMELTGQSINAWGTSFLRYGLMAAGFYFTTRIPRYWQEVNGHSTSGGHEMAALAGGYMLGRFGGRMLQNSRGGQILGSIGDRRGAGVARKIAQVGHREAPGAAQGFRDTQAAYQDRFGGKLGRLQSAKEQGGIKGFAAGAVLGAGSVAAATVGGAHAAKNVTKKAVTYPDRAAVNSRAITRAYQGQTRAMQTRVDVAAGAYEVELGADTEEALAREAAHQSMPTEATLSGRAPQGFGGEGLPRLDGAIAKAPPGEAKRLWDGVADQLRKTGQSYELPERRARQSAPKHVTVGTLGAHRLGRPQRLSSDAYTHVAVNAPVRRHALEQAAEAPEIFMANALGYADVDALEADTSAPRRIQVWLQEHAAATTGLDTAHQVMPPPSGDQLAQRLSSFRRKIRTIQS